jgi:hypothetical protein
VFLSNNFSFAENIISTMANSKIESKILEDLKSGEPKRIISAMHDMYEHGNAQNMKVLLSAVMESLDEHLYEELIPFLFNLKDIEALEPILEAIKNPKSAPIRKELVEALWQAGLDCNGHLSMFVDLAVKEDYLMAIEAITVIESMVPPIEEVELSRCIKKIEDALPKADVEKKKLLESLIITLKEFNKPILPEFSEN